MRKKFADSFTQAALRKGYPARSVFKLTEIDKKFRIFKKGQKVVDLGCAPGSWSMFAAEKVGSNGLVVGLDQNTVELAKLKSQPNVELIQADVFTWTPPSTLLGHTDVLLSDMAPKTTGVKAVDALNAHELGLCALELAKTTLHDQGSFVLKTFHGANFKELLTLVKESFQNVSVFKPKSSRKESVETFLIARKKTPK